ncbi:MAG: hypothetical protein JNK05_32510 [Myxococcales bacterium]|nr:hypothetical protein [Myxococcales bacterium]
MSNLVCAQSFGVVLCVQNAHVTTDEEWERLMAIIRQVKIDHLRILAFTDGGAPNVRQRGELIDYLGGKTPPIAVVSASALVKGVATAISWFNPRIKVFSPADVSKAFAHLSITAASGNGLVEEAMSLATSLTGGVPGALARNTERAVR